MEQGKGRICSVCGTVNNENAKFCFECGNKFEEQKVCPKCGRAYEEGMKFCPECGASLINGADVKGEPSELMADPLALDEDEGIVTYEATVFGSSMQRSEINIITLTDKMDEISGDAWDVSANQDRSVMACVKQNEDLIELVIAGKNGIKANKNCFALFAGYFSAEKLNIKCEFDTSGVTDMSNMFSYCRNLVNIDVRGFDTSQVTNMSSMFSYCRNLVNIDVSGFDTSQVTNMCGMFDSCKALSEIDVSGFDTSQVIHMSDMFSSCEKLLKIDVRRFDTSHVTDMSGM